MHVLEARFRNVGVNLSCCEAFVAQQFLNDPQIGPTLKEVGGIGVPQGVRVNVALPNPGVQDPPDVSGCQALPSPVEKQGAPW